MSGRQIDFLTFLLEKEMMSAQQILNAFFSQIDRMPTLLGAIFKVVDFDSNKAKLFFDFLTQQNKIFFNQLVESQLLTQEQLDCAFKEYSAHRTPLLQVLVETNVLRLDEAKKILEEFLSQKDSVSSDELDFEDEVGQTNTILAKEYCSFFNEQKFKSVTALLNELDTGEKIHQLFDELHVLRGLAHLAGMKISDFIISFVEEILEAAMHLTQKTKEKGFKFQGQELLSPMQCLWDLRNQIEVKLQELDLWKDQVWRDKMTRSYKDCIRMKNKLNSERMAA